MLECKECGNTTEFRASQKRRFAVDGDGNKVRSDYYEHTDYYCEKCGSKVYLVGDGG